MHDCTHDLFGHGYTQISDPRSLACYTRGLPSDLESGDVRVMGVAVVKGVASFCSLYNYIQWDLEIQVLTEILNF